MVLKPTQVILKLDLTLQRHHKEIINWDLWKWFHNEMGTDMAILQLAQAVANQHLPINITQDPAVTVKQPLDHWPETLMILLIFLGVESEEELLEHYKKLAQANKKEECVLIQNMLQT